MIEKTEFNDYANCLRLSNGAVDLVIATDFGPRILFYGFQDGENILGWHADAKVETALGTWRPYGGHRLWLAPENMPLSYAPDNAAVEHFAESDLSVHLIQSSEAATNTQKEIIVTLDEIGSGATVEHRITNRGDYAIELAAWALTIMRGGGRAIVPHENFAPYSPQTLLPVRSLALWSYTDFTDARWRFEKDYISLQTDENLHHPQKIGVFNKRGFAAYEWQNLLFVKHFDVVEDAVYPDLNSNTEIYVAGSFVEIESLSPLVKLPPGESIVYTESWQLFANTEIETLFEK